MDFENRDGFPLHKHARFAWLGSFFESLNMSFAQNCLIVSNGSSYCSNFNNQIAILVNGKANDQFEHYILKDGDTILISYDNNDDLHKQFAYINLCSEIVRSNSPSNVSISLSNRTSNT